MRWLSLFICGYFHEHYGAPPLWSLLQIMKERGILPLQVKYQSIWTTVDLVSETQRMFQKSKKLVDRGQLLPTWQSKWQYKGSSKWAPLNKSLGWWTQYDSKLPERAYSMLWYIQQKCTWQHMNTNWSPSFFSNASLQLPTIRVPVFPGLNQKSTLDEVQLHNPPTSSVVLPKHTAEEGVAPRIPRHMMWTIQQNSLILYSIRHVTITWRICLRITPHESINLIWHKVENRTPSNAVLSGREQLGEEDVI